MKLIRIKNVTTPVRCSFCKTAKTLYRIQGNPHYGATACTSCFSIEKQKKDAYDAIWANREQSEAEFQLRI